MMKVLRGGQRGRVRGAAGVLPPAPRQRAAARGAKEKARRAAPDDRDDPSCHKGVKLEAEGLVREELHEGQLDAPPGLQSCPPWWRRGSLCSVLASGLVPARRGGARARARGAARGGAAAAGSRGGSATLGTCFTWRLLLFGANLRNVGAPRMEPLRGNGFFFRPARARWREARTPRHACRPSGTPRGPRARGAGPPKETRRTGGRRPIGQASSFRCLAVAGRTGGRPQLWRSVSPPPLPIRRRANPSARAAKQEHANQRPTVAAPPPRNAPRRATTQKPGAPNTTDKTHRARARTRSEKIAAQALEP